MTTYRIHRENQTTAQVVAALSKHPSWKAEAQDTDEFCPCEASTDGMHIQFDTKYPEDSDFDGVDRSPPVRSDWTIYRPKRKRVEVGFSRYVDGRWLTGTDCSGLDKSKRHKLIAVEE